MSKTHDVVVTGLGAATPFGVGLDPLWEGVRRGSSGVDWISSIDVTDYPVRYGAELKDFSVDDYLKKHCEVRREKSVQLGLVATREALGQSGLLNDDEIVDASLPVGAVLGSGHGPCHEAEFGYACFFQRGPKALRPTTVPKSMFNALTSNVSIHFGLRGTNHVIASACASGTVAIGTAYMLVKHGYEEIVLCGGADSPFTAAMFACWTNLRVLAKHDVPQQASRPFDRQRNGLVLGEGAAAVVLESAESAGRRGVQPLARVIGFGATSDAYHITAPTVIGQMGAMKRCLDDAGLAPDEIDYVNLHGTATKANDETEAHAVLEVFGTRGADMPVSSTKSMLGHALGASGAIEFLVCVETIRDNFVSPTINCDEPDPDVGLDYVPNRGREKGVDIAMSNSFAFGGNNASILVERSR